MQSARLVSVIDGTSAARDTHGTIFGMPGCGGRNGFSFLPLATGLYSGWHFATQPCLAHHTGKRRHGYDINVARLQTRRSDSVKVHLRGR
jgi:hypothetical protein